MPLVDLMSSFYGPEPKIPEVNLNLSEEERAIFALRGAACSNCKYFMGGFPEEDDSGVEVRVCACEGNLDIENGSSVIDLPESVSICRLWEQADE